MIELIELRNSKISSITQHSYLSDPSTIVVLYTYMYRTNSCKVGNLLKKIKEKKKKKK